MAGNARLIATGVAGGLVTCLLLRGAASSGQVAPDAVPTVQLRDVRSKAPPAGQAAPRLRTTRGQPSSPPTDRGVAWPCPGAGDCCVANGSPGCDDATCCAAICAINSFCCSFGWDRLCADLAAADPVNCPQCQPGACCLLDGTCVEATSPDCAALGGQFQGPLTDCASVNCPPPPSGVNFFLDAVAFDAAIANTPKLQKVFWDFKPNKLPVPGGTFLNDPLNIDTHALDTTDPWSNFEFPSGDCCIQNGTPGCEDPVCEASICAFVPSCCDVLWDNFCRVQALSDPNCDCIPVPVANFWPPEFDNVTFQSNLGPNPQPPLPNPRGIDGLRIFNGLAGFDNNMLFANLLEDSFDIISGPPAGDAHTAIAIEVIELFGTGPVLVTVYDTNEVPIGNIKVDSVNPPPPNENCANVVPFPLVRDVPVTFTGDNTGAINECGIFAGFDGHVWEAIIMPAGVSTLNLQYCGSSNSIDGGPFGNSWLNLAIGCPCSGITSAATFFIGCADGNIEMQWTGLTPGATYYYPVLLDPQIGSIGPYTLTFTAKNPPGPPNNDLCADRVTIDQDVLTAFDTTAATTDGAPDPLCLFSANDQIFNDIWYNFTPSQSLTYNISLCASSFDTKLAVYSGCACPTGAVIACNDDGCVVRSQVNVDLIAGQCYKIRVGGFDTTSAGLGTILISKQPPPPGVAGGRAGLGHQPRAIRAVGRTGKDGGVAGGAPKKVFLGIITKDEQTTIGRINLFSLDNGGEGISSIAVYQATLSADLTGPGGVPDGCVDAFDLGAMLGAWCSAVNDPNPPSPPCENCTPANLAVADISGSGNAPDGCVDAFDLAKLLTEWCSVAGGNPCGTCQ